MARTTIFPTQEVAFSYSFMGAFPAESITPAPFTLELGKTYAVQWGDTLFENLSVIDLADAGFTGGAIGNGSILDFPGNNEPFAIAYFSGDFPEIMILFLDGSESQTITVYLEDAEGGGGEGETTNPIVLKDRTGTGIEYEGVEGVRVFDKDGNPHVFVPPVETEEKTVELDFSGGAMEVTPTAGKLLSKVGIPVPENLLPENIAEGIRIAGIDGTLKSGGGAKPYLFAIRFHEVNFSARSSQFNGSQGYTASIPLNATVLYEKGFVHFARSSSYSSGSQASQNSYGYSAGATNMTLVTPKIVQSNTHLNYQYSFPVQLYQYTARTCVFEVFFNLPGVYMVEEDDGTLCMCADSTLTLLAGNTMHIHGATKADLSNSRISAVPVNSFQNSSFTDILLPPTVTDIATYALYSAKIMTIDMSKHTAVPTVASNSIHKHTGLKILVPAALYDEWIAAANWSSLASYIVAV